jgi:crotonobetainyl-CoA:carnitine CoA-transferase CaiB-like acyl-CoA transferase
VTATGTGAPLAPRDYARALLAKVGASAAVPERGDRASPAERWARCGAMALTGFEEGPPLPAPGALAACAGGALIALRALAPAAPLPTDGAALLGEHAACLGHRRRGRTSAGGTCRLLPSADGWIAVNLARRDDVAAVPAWLECEVGGDAWGAVERGVARRKQADLLERGRLLSLPVAASLPPPETPPAWLSSGTARIGEALPAPPSRAPLVVDLTALWAGPLCTSLLALAGARVVKVESTGRPDGARGGNAHFFDLLNAGKASVALDFASGPGRRALQGLVARADVVVEGTRPRALAQLGIDAEAFVAERPGRTWVSITGYGRRDPAPGRVAFGDDAAVAAGLAEATARLHGLDGPIFCADAIADPLTGLHAAVAAWASWRAGGGWLLDLALRDVAGHALGAGGPGPASTLPAAPPRARPAPGAARPLGADTRAVLGELDIPC